MKAIAAMSLNRVIGAAGRIPWHLPEDFRFFKEMTSGNVIVLGRKTFESIGRPLPNRLNVVVSRTMERPDTPAIEVLRDLEDLDEAKYAPREVWIAGGAEIYERLLPSCTDLFLSVVQKEVEGDAYFPEFEDHFGLVQVVKQFAEFEIRHYRRSR